MSSSLQHIRAQLTAVLEGLPGAAEPHVVEVELHGGHLAVLCASGARFEIWHGGPDVSLVEVDRAAQQRSHRWAHEPYDVYRVAASGVAAVEVRSLAGESLLELVVRTEGRVLRARVVQDDEARWQAEDDGIIGEDLQDFAERNAIWTGLGGPRPRGWQLQVVEPGESWPK